MQPKTLGLGVLIIAALGLFWEMMVDLLNVAPFLLPPPSAILSEFVDRPGLYLGQSLSTLYSAVVGFAVATVAGVAIGTMIVYSWILRGLLYPVILVLQVVPKVALAPLFIIWVGYGMTSRVLIVAMISFFPIVMNTVVGLSSVERDLLDLVKMLKGSKVQQFIKVAFPHAMPVIFSGLKVAVTLAVIGEVVAEFISGNEGLGYLILVANSELNVAMAFAALLLLTFIGYALFGAMELLEKLFIPWNDEEDERAAAVA